MPRVQSRRRNVPSAPALPPPVVPSAASGPDAPAPSAAVVAPSRTLSLRSDDGEQGGPSSSSDDYSIASVTMSVQSADDLPPNAPSCLRCFPTGAECMRFYVLVFISACVMLSGVAYMIARPDDAAGRCVFTGLMTTVMSFWIQPPTIGVQRRGGQGGRRRGSGGGGGGV